MNAIGRFGSFIIEYQDPILIGLLLFLAVILVILAARLFIHARRKNAILSQINDTVSEINSAVNQFGEKKPELIYIDNRMADQRNAVSAEDGDSQRKTEAQADLFSQNGEAAGTGSAGSSEEEDPEDGRTQAHMAAAEAEQPEQKAPLKYFSRDCAVAKDGTVYTREGLSSQIRE